MKKTSSYKPVEPWHGVVQTDGGLCKWLCFLGVMGHIILAGGQQSWSPATQDDEIELTNSDRFDWPSCVLQERLQLNGSEETLRCCLDEHGGFDADVGHHFIDDSNLYIICRSNTTKIRTLSTLRSFLIPLRRDCYPLPSQSMESKMT
jgi:hypothetical protein